MRPMRWGARPRGKRRQPIPGKMNHTETRYADLLTSRVIAGEVLNFSYEPLRLRLAKNTFYVPDFLVQLADGEIEIHEVKGGHMEDDSWVKLKVAAELFPFRFRLCRQKNKSAPWVITDVQSGDE